MFKNVASQKILVYAYDTAADGPKTGDAANITAYISLDCGTPAQSNDVNPTELDATNMQGFYYFDLTQAETNCDLFALSPVSATANIKLEPISLFTTPPNFNALGIESDGDLTKVNTLDGHTPQTGDNYARIGAPAGVSVSADVAAVKVDTAAIDAKTTNLPADPASETNATTNAAGINTNIDANETKIDAIAVQTTAIQAVTDLFSFTTGNVHSIPKAKDNTVGLSTQEKDDVHTEALKVRSTDTMSELTAMTDVPAEPTPEQAMMLTYMERRNGVTTTDALHSIFNDAGSPVLEQAISDDTITATASQLTDP